MKNAEARHVFLLEEQVREKPIGYDHVFSFFSNPADSFFHDYLSETYMRVIYDEEFVRLIEFIEQMRRAHPFSYRGVDLLWCFKKISFNYVLYVRHYMEMLSKLSVVFPRADFYITNTPEIMQYPTLAKILEEYPTLAYAHRIHRIAAHASAQLPVLPTNKPVLGPFRWPNQFVFGAYKNARMVIFSDFEKCKAVLKKARAMAPVLYCNTVSPRNIARAFCHRFSIYQVAYDAQRFGHAYDEKAREYAQLLQKNPLFEKCHFSDPSIGRLLNAQVCRFFKKDLPKLLYDIDAMHAFFSKATKLESALLDEDTSVTNSAFCQVARAYGVFTAVECHGAPGHKIGLFPLSADKLLVWGTAQKNKLISWGCPSESLAVTGCSRYSEYQNMDFGSVRRRIARKFRLREENPILLFGPSRLTAYRGRWFFEKEMLQSVEKVLAGLEKILTENPAIQLILKVHSGDEYASYYSRWAKKQVTRNIRVVNKYDPLLLAKAADLLVIYNSTYAVEGFALGKPVLYFSVPDDQMICEIRDYGVIICPQDMDEMVFYVEKIIKQGWTPPPRWQEARQACLNETSAEPASIIASLLKGRSVQKKDLVHV